MIYNLLDDTKDMTTAHCESLIRKWAPVFMRVGGGSVSRADSRATQAVTLEERAEMVKLRKKGMALADIAARTNRSEASVSKHLLAAGMPALRAKKITEGQRHRMEALRAKGWKLQAIADKLGCGLETVSGHLRRLRAESLETKAA